MNIQISSKEPIVTAKKLLEHKRAYGHLADFKAPETVLVCYQSSTMDVSPQKSIRNLSLRKRSPTFIFQMIARSVFWEIGG